MELSLSISDGCAHVVISGAIATQDAGRLLAEVEGLPDEVRSIEFDLERVDYLSSAGIRALLRAAHIAGGRGGDLKVVRCSEFVREILTVVGLNQKFHVPTVYGL